MDPLSFASSSLAFISSCGRLQRNLKQVKSAPKAFSNLLVDLNACSSAVNRLVDVLQETPETGIASDGLQSLDSSLRDAMSQILDFNRSLERALDKRGGISAVIVQTLLTPGRHLQVELSQLSAILALFLQLNLGSRPLSADGLQKFRIRRHSPSILSDGGNDTRSTASIVQPDTSFDDYHNTLSLRHRRFLKELKFEPAPVSVAIWPAREAVSDAYHIRRQSADEWMTTFSERDNSSKPSARSRKKITGTTATLIYCDHGPKEISANTMPMTASMYARIMLQCTIPAEFGAELIRGMPVFRAVDHDVDRNKLNFLLRMPLTLTCNWTLAISWALQGQHGPSPSLYYFLHGATHSEIESLFHALEEVQEVAAHPLTLPVILCELAADADVRELRRHAINLYSVELRTNYLRLDELTRTGVQAEDELEDLTRRVNAITSRLAFLEMRLRSCARITDEISGFHQVLAKRNTFEWKLDAWHAPESMLSERINCLKATHGALPVEISCNQKVASGQLQILYNLIAQRDNRNNLKMTAISTSIARNTKEDSFAMRTIAIMTVSFLPATAVSSLFSMSMFNWNAAGTSEPVVSKFFWIYWVVAGLLTAAVLGLWFLWMQVHQRNEREEERKNYGSQLDHIPAWAGVEPEATIAAVAATAAATVADSEREPVPKARHRYKYDFGASSAWTSLKIGRRQGGKEKAPDPEKTAEEEIHSEPVVPSGQTWDVGSLPNRS